MIQIVGKFYLHRTSWLVVRYVYILRPGNVQILSSLSFFFLFQLCLIDLQFYKYMLDKISRRNARGII
jgi:hypothetical protein